LANTKDQGTNLKDVNSALDQLNTYSDKTIYNFGQMAKNIGTFTAAGVDLDTSVQSIKGISNLAAISGSSSEQASTAMYQLSQAISTGTLKLQDWNSVTNAGMGGKVFQKALFETGKALGTIKDTPIDQTFDQWTDAGNSFRGSLTKGWLTSEVLTTTLQGFTGEMTQAQLTAKGFTKEQAKAIIELGKTGVDAATQVRTLSGLIDTTKEAIGSGWSASFRIVFGNFKEATKLFTGISQAVGNMVSKSAKARNELLQGWKDLGGRTLLIESLKTTIKNLGKILKPIKDAFHDIFPPATSKDLFRLTKGFSELAKALRPSRKTVDEVRRIFRGFFSALSLGWEIIKRTVKFVGSLLKSFSGAGSGDFLKFAAQVGDFFTHLRSWLVEGGALDRFFNKLGKAIKPQIPIIKEFIGKVVEFLGKVGKAVWALLPVVRRFVDKTLGAFGDLKDLIVELAPIVKKFVDKFLGAFKGLDIKKIIKDPIPYLKGIKDRILGLFKGFDPKAPKAVTNIMDRFRQRFETFKKVFDKIKEVWRPFKTGFDRVMGVLDKVWTAIRNWFSQLGKKLAKAIKPGEFDATVDALNVGLLGGIIVLFRKFLKGGFKFDIGGGLLDKISSSFDQLNGIMKAMQTDIKANALMKIAGAIAILTAAVVVLSLIDSASLTKALTAMAVGFGQLLVSFKILSNMSSGVKGAAQFDALAAGLMLISGAMLVLAIAMKVLATMSWEEIGKGLTAITGLLAVMTAAVKLMPQKSMISTGIGMIAIAVAMTILAGAVKLFAMMDWGELAKGFVAVTGSLAGIALAMRLMPKNMALQGVGLLLVATSLSILAGVMKIFATMKWEDLAKGMVGLAGSLLIIAAAMNLMPATMPLIGAGLLLVSIGLLAISKALLMMGGMSWSEIAKGLVAMAGSLLILTVAANAMQSAILGFVAMTIAGAALLILAKALQAFAGLSWGDLLKGLIGIAAVLATLAISAMLIQPAIPALLLLGAALLLVGAGFALFGFGAQLVANAFATLAKVGKKGAQTFLASLEALGKALPTILKGFGEGLIDLIQTFIDAAPAIAKGLIVLIGHILDGLDKLLPKVFKVISKLISGILKLIREKYPELVQTGLGLLVSLLEGIRNNLPKVVHLVGEIITGFLDALTEEIPRVVTSLQNFLTTVIEQVVIGLNPATLMLMIGNDLVGGLWQGVWDKFQWLIDKVVGFFTSMLDKIKDFLGIHSPATKMLDIGKDIINGLFNGLKTAVVKVMGWFKDLGGKIIKWIGNMARLLFRKGKDLIVGLFSGILKQIPKVITWFKNVSEKVLVWIGNLELTLLRKGKDLIKGLWDGIWARVQAVIQWFKDFSVHVVTWIGNLVRTLFHKGRELIKGLWDGIWERVQGVITWFKDLSTKVVSWIGNLLSTLWQKGVDLIQGLWDGIVWLFTDAPQSVAGWFGNIAQKVLSALPTVEELKNILFQTGKDIMQGLWDGLVDLWDKVWAWVTEQIHKIPKPIRKLLGIDSPSKVFMEIGHQIMEGLAIGLMNNKNVDRAQENTLSSLKSFNNHVKNALEEVGTIDEFRPIITPVLDLTSVQADAKKIGGYIKDVQKIRPELSFAQAKAIAVNVRPQPVESQDAASVRGNVKFEQNIYAPRQLSTNDIYKQTRNQITMAKEELSIP